MATGSTSPPASVEEIIQGYQFERTVEIPGKDGLPVPVTIGLLWDDEMREIYRETGRRVAQGDFLSRDVEVRFEILVRAIVKIGEWECSSPDDRERDAELKSHLRRILGKHPRMIEYLHAEYTAMRDERDRAWDEAVGEIKKSSRLPDSRETVESQLPNGSSDGEAGGGSSSPEHPSSSSR